MRATKQQVNRLSELLARVHELAPTAREGYKARGLSEVRWLWDCLHAANGLDGFEDITSRALYKSGLNDNHITTALRAASKMRG